MPLPIDEQSLTVDQKEGGGVGDFRDRVEKGWRATDKSDLFVAATRVHGGPRINSVAMKETATRRRKRKQGGGGGGDSAA